MKSASNNQKIIAGLKQALKAARAQNRKHKATIKSLRQKLTKRSKQPVKRILLDDNIVYEDNTKGKVYLEIPVYPNSLEGITKEKLILEMNFSENNSLPCLVESHRLVEEKHLENGEVEVVQEFWLSPDAAYVLFLKFLKTDLEVFPENYPGGVKHEF